MILRGLGKVLSSLKDLEKVPIEVEGKLYREAERVMGISVQRAPVRDGELRRSRFVNHPVRSGRTVEVTMGYTAPHAEAVHENPSEHDPITWQGKKIEFKGGSPKFLSSAIADEESSVIDNVADAIKV